MSEPNSKLLTIVIPVHKMAFRLGNLENTLRSTASVVDKTHFVIIHDKGDSATYPQLIALQRIFSFELFEVEYGSPGLARNEGMKYSNSEWICFWDSDDIGNVEEVINSIIECPREKTLIIGEYEIIKFNEQVANGNFKKKVNSLKHVMINPGIWRMAFRCSTLGDARFIKGRMGEDQAYLATLNIREEDVFYTRRHLYKYFIGDPQQLTSNSDSILEIKSAMEKVQEILKLGNQSEDYVYIIWARLLLTSIKRRVVSFPDVFRYIFTNSKPITKSQMRKFNAIAFVLTHLLLERK